MSRFLHSPLAMVRSIRRFLRSGFLNGLSLAVVGLFFVAPPAHAVSCGTFFARLGSGIFGEGDVEPSADPDAVHYPDGTVAWKARGGLVGRARILVRTPEGTSYSFFRTDRALGTLTNDDLYPEQFLSTQWLKGKRVLDFASGGGSVVRALRGNGIDAHGVDIYLDPKQRKLPYFSLSSGEALPHPDGSFDVIFATWSSLTYYGYELNDLHQREREGKASPESRARAAAVEKKLHQSLAEIARVLRPGGSLLLSPAPFEGDRSRFTFQLLQSALRQAAPSLHVAEAPGAQWIARRHGVANVGPAGVDAQFPSEIWVRLEKR